jgi:hypothetical protein
MHDCEFVIHIRLTVWAFDFIRILSRCINDLYLTYLEYSLNYDQEKVMESIKKYCHINSCNHLVILRPIYIYIGVGGDHLRIIKSCKHSEDPNAGFQLSHLFGRTLKEIEK